MSNIDNYIKYDGVTHVHNIYLHTLYAGGIPALFLLLCVMCLLIAISLRGSRCKHNESSFWGVICLLSLVGCLVSGIGGDVFQGRRDISTIFWFAVGMTLALPSIHKSHNVNDINKDNVRIADENNRNIARA